MLLAPGKSTSDEVTDGAKRVFFEQRLKSANDAKGQAAALEKVRKENEGVFKEAQAKKRVVAKSVRESASKSRAALLTERTRAAAALRESKRSLTERHKERLQATYLEKAATVKAVIANSIYREGEATGGSPYAPGSSPPGSPKGLRSPPSAQLTPPTAVSTQSRRSSTPAIAADVAE